MFPGLPTRVENDIKELFLINSLQGDKSRLGKFKLNIEDPPRRKHMVFQGGALFASLTEDTPEQWVTSINWRENGSIVK